MLNKYTIEQIQGLPIEQVAEALGLDVRKHRSLCPFHEDTHPSLYFRVNINRFRCYVCNHYGGNIDLCMKLLNLNFRDAVCWLAQAFGITIEDSHVRQFANVKPRKVKPVRKEEIHPIDPDRLARYVGIPELTTEACHFLFDERKLHPKVIEWCGISSYPEHLVIPYYDMQGKLLTVQFRYMGKDPEQPRFTFPKGCACPIYNLQILPLLKEREDLFVCEGCSDCWAMLSNGFKAIAIPSATLLKPNDWAPVAKVLKEKSIQLHMYPDNDKPGEQLFRQLQQLVPNIIRHSLPSGCKDYAEYYMCSKVN